MITIHYKLNPWLVGTHFLLSIVVLALGVLVALEAWDDPRRAGQLRRSAALALVVGAACGALILSGVARDRGRPALRLGRRSARLEVRAGRLAARPRDGGLRR